MRHWRPGAGFRQRRTAQRLDCWLFRPACTQRHRRQGLVQRAKPDCSIALPLTTPTLQNKLRRRLRRLADCCLTHPWAAPPLPGPSGATAAAAARRMPTLRSAATWYRCLRLGAGGWRRACGDGRAASRPAELAARAAHAYPAPQRCRVRHRSLLPSLLPSRLEPWAPATRSRRPGRPGCPALRLHCPLLPPLPFFCTAS